MQTLQDTIAIWDEQMMIGAIRMIANARNWVEVQEQWTDGDILEMLSENQYDLPKTLTSIYMNITDTSYKHQREYDPDNYRGI